MSFSLIVSDVEGCIIPARRGRWDHKGLAALAEYNEAARSGYFPPLTLCTGRPAQFVDAVGQAIGLFVPAICENGGVLYDPASGKHVPLYAVEDRARLDQIRDYMDSTWVKQGWVRLSRGKEICVSIVPLTDRWADIRQLHSELLERLESDLKVDLSALNITFSASAVDITPASIDKGTGVREILDRLGAAADKTLAIGDGGNDLPMFRLCGLAAAPANALPEVKKAADYISPSVETQGVLDVLHRFIGFQPDRNWR